MIESFNTLCEAADAAMFSAILSNRNHVIHQLLIHNLLLSSMNSIHQI